MPGYTWTVLCRMTPQDGPAEVVNLSTAFTFGGAARSVLVKAEPQYQEESEAREDINLALRPLLLGYRRSLMLTFDVTDPAAHGATIAQILTRSMSPYWTVEFSLNNGTTYVPMVLRRAGSPKPLGGKTPAGFRVEHSWQSRDLTDAYPAIGAGTSW